MNRRRTRGQQRRYRRDLMKNASGAHPVEGVRAVNQQPKPKENQQP